MQKTTLVACENVKMGALLLGQEMKRGHWSFDTGTQEMGQEEMTIVQVIAIQSVVMCPWEFVKNIESQIPEGISQNLHFNKICR